MSIVTDSEMKKAFELFVAGFKKKAGDKLRKSKRGIWTGKMLASIDGTIQHDGEGYFVELDAEEYAHYLDQGVNGKKTRRGSQFSFRDKMPPISAIKPWADSKGINPYAVQRSIYMKGIKPIYFLEKSMIEEEKHLLDYLAEAQVDALLNGFDDND